MSPALRLPKPPRRNPDAPRVTLRQRCAAFRQRAKSAVATTAKILHFPIKPAVSRDAELLRLGKEQEAAYALYCAPWLPDDELDARGDVVSDLEYAIHRIPAQTWAGVVVKARIAAQYLPTDVPDQPTLDDIFPSLINDILRLGGVPSTPATTLLH